VVRPLVPDPENALDRPDGLCGLAGSIGVPETIEGYRRGMFLMSHVGPLTWWSSSARVVLFFDQARIDKTTRRLLRNQRFRITFDRAFPAVMEACATPRPGQTPLTWITPRIRALFNAAHAEGHAHSVEVWQDDQLVAWGFALNDGKHPTRYLADVGMTPVTRAEFRALLETWCARPGKAGMWEVDPALLDDGWTPAVAAGETMTDVMPAPSACPWTMEELLTTHRNPTW
jgi:leucyl/phenylalanyl-tRNA--protein transferase